MWAQSCVGTIVCGHNRVWAQSCLGTIVSGHNRVWAQTCVGTIVSGHKRVWAQSCLGTIVCGHNRVWAQSCGLNRVGSIMYGPNRVVSAQTRLHQTVHDSLLVDTVGRVRSNGAQRLACIAASAYRISKNKKKEGVLNVLIFFLMSSCPIPTIC